MRFEAVTVPTKSNGLEMAIVLKEDRGADGD